MTIVQCSSQQCGSFLIGILIGVVLLAIAFHLQVRAVQHAENRPIEPKPPDQRDFDSQPSLKQKTAWNPSLALVPLFLIILVGRWFSRITYYDYFLDATLFWPLLAISTTAMLAASLTSGVFIRTATQWWTRVLIQLFPLVLTLALGWATVTILPPALMDFMLALRNGPQLASGTIEATNMTGGRGAIASITVDNAQYVTYDFGWWNTLRRGQTIQFVHDPAHTAAFEPAKIGLTPVGGAVSSCIGAVWLWVGGFVVWRFQQTMTARRRI